MRNLFLVSLFLLIFLMAPGEILASTLSVSGGNVGVGSAISVRLNLNTAGEAVNGFSATLSYPVDKIEVSSISYSSRFAIAAEGTYGGGQIRISRGNINPVSGSVTVATINFRGKAVGSAAVSVTSGAVPRASDSSDSYSGGSGANINVVTAPASAPSIQSGTQAGPTQAAQPAAALKLSDINLLNISTNSATVTWNTDRAADSYIEYGLEKSQYFVNVSDGNLFTKHSLTLEGPLLTPGASFHFRVISKDANNNASQSDDMTFQLLGYKVILRLLDSAGAPLRQTEVKLYSEAISGKTNDDGVVEFENVTAGKHLLVVKTSGLEKTAEIDISKTPEAQSFDVKVDLLAGRRTYDQLIPFLGGAVVAAVIILGVILYKRKKGSGLQALKML